MDYEVYQYTDREKGHYFLSEVTGNKRRAYALAKKPDKYFVFQGNYRLPSDNINKKTMTMKQTEETTKPSIMEQYNELKEKHPGAVLLFRIGDFYEAYDEDATKIGEILGVTITRKLNSKEKGSDGHALKLAGFPHHALDTYLPKLIRAGVRVAICDHLEGSNKVTDEYSPSDEKEAKPETDETKVQEETKPSEDIETLKAQHKKEIETLKAQYEEQMKDLRTECEELKQGYSNFANVRLVIRESIKALKGEIPSSLAGYFYNMLGELEVIKIKNNLNFRLTSDEVNFLISEASKSQNK